MTDRVREFIRETLKLTPKDVLQSLSAEERLEGLPPEDLLKGLSPEERLKGLSVEEVLKALSLEARESLAKQLKANGSPSKQE